MVTADKETLAMFIGPADITGNRIAPRMRLTIADFKDLWYVCDYGEGGYIAVHMMRALSTAGLSIQSTDRNKVQFSFEFTGHYSMKSQDAVLYEITIVSKEAA